MNRELIAIAAANPLFWGIPVEDMPAVLAAVDACKVRAQKGEQIVLDGVRSMAVVLEGMIQIVQDDYWGNRSIIHMLMPGKTMGESFTEFPGVNLNLKAVAQTDVLLLAFSKDKLLSSGFAQQKQVLENLLGIYSIHQRIFMQKFQILSRRKTRERLLAYLSMLANEKGCAHFSVPFNRQEMADYLCVERSAMCSELSAMQKEGILRFKGKEFELLHASEA
ncbi:MAG: Crp/Fnr family transcriptional regulator [Clostridia bacterium]|nr:Crp/Fnr family transcriptional regulator [Clostridia bacterium]